VRPFAYERAESAAGAIATVTGGADGSVSYLAGGTNLVDLMRLGVETPERLVDLTRLPYDRIEATDGGGLRIGALVRNADLAADRRVRSGWPVLSQALLSGASGQLRNLATTGGNLLQRTRCPYFQDVSKPCNKRLPGSGCPAREGEHRNLAILGHSTACVATHPSDMAVALATLDATVHVEGPDGPRAIPVDAFYRLPEDQPERDTDLERGELITAVELDPSPIAARSRYRKVRDRASFSFAVVSLAAAVELTTDGEVADVRLALGGVAHAPWRALHAENALRGAPATEREFERAADAELALALPLRDNGFKVGLARNLIVRTLTELCAP
jgi:xanthine dehydrogenase YagS FAD-binding subunit